MSDKIQWDWKLNWPKCRFNNCNEDSTDECWQQDGFRFCKDHYTKLRNEFSIVLYDAINPDRKLNENCKNQESHYKTLCDYGILGECICENCGSPIHICKTDNGCKVLDV